ncbi:MAG: amidase [Bryobacteraceae bacterium]
MVGGPDVIARCLRRIAEQDGEIRAWVEVAPQFAARHPAASHPTAPPVATHQLSAPETSAGEPAAPEAEAAAHPPAAPHTAPPEAAAQHPAPPEAEAGAPEASAGQPAAPRGPDRSPTVGQANRLPHHDGPLAGIPFGAKDIFETRGMATEYGSPLYAGRKGEADAAVIAELRAQGAILLGKTQTTAFASFDAAPTRNPRAPGHTPGGSSAGSAAAVAAGMVPFALGTQTLGSVLRPASYCGVCGFKPSFGLIPIEGVLPFAPSLDTVGFFTATVEDMNFLWSRGFGGSSDVALRDLARLRVPCEEPMARAMEDAAQRLRAAGIRVDDMDPPAGWEAVVEAAYAINTYEGARTHERLYRDFGERIGERLAALVRRGLAMPAEEYEAARERVERMRGEISRILWEYPAILSPAATGPPPAGFDFTGDPAANAPWTALGVPAISVPLPGYDLPMGLQLTGAWGRDDAVVVVAAQAERFLGNAERLLRNQVTE